MPLYNPTSSLVQTGLVGLFSSLGSVTVPANVDVIFTSGYSTKGVGAGRYVSTATAVATAYRKASADGRYWVLDERFATVDHYGALGDGTTDDLTAFHAMRDHIGGARGRKGACYAVSGSIDFGSSFGGWIEGGGYTADENSPTGFLAGSATSIKCTGSNQPILKIWGPATVRDVVLFYSSQQTRASHPNSYGIELNWWAGGSIRNVSVKRATVGIGIPQANHLNIPGGTTTNNIAYNSTIDQVIIDTVTECHLDLRGYNGGGTNITISNIYFLGGWGYQWGTTGQNTNYVMRITNMGGLHIANTSIDAEVCDQYPIDIVDSLVTFGSLRFENMQVNKAASRIMSITGGTGKCHVTVDTFEFSDGRIRTADGVTTCDIFYCTGGDATLDVRTLKFDAANTFTVASPSNLKLLTANASTQAIRIGPVANLTGGSLVTYQWGGDNEYQNVREWDNSLTMISWKVPLVSNAPTEWIAKNNGWDAPLINASGYSTSRSWTSNCNIIAQDSVPNSPWWYYKQNSGTSAASGWTVRFINAPHTGTIGARSTVASSIANTETQVVDSSIGVNNLRVGSRIKVKAVGVMTNTTSASTSTWRVRIGASSLSGAIAASGAFVNTTTARTDVIVRMEAMILITALGASGSARGQLWVDGGSTDQTQAPPGGLTAGVTIDTTSNLHCEMTFISGAASTTFTCTAADIELVHP